jgi:CrcB protein
VTALKKYIFIGFGGFLGAVSRYFIKNIHIYHYREVIPINTLIINVVGSFLIGLLLTIAFEIWEMDDHIRLGVTTGFLGAFTTFSTLCKDTVQLLKNGDYYSAISYLTMSTVLGLIAVYLGIVVAREVVAKIVKQEPDVDAVE